MFLQAAGIASFPFHLFGGFAIDGSHEQGDRHFLEALDAEPEGGGSGFGGDMLSSVNKG